MPGLRTRFSRLSRRSLLAGSAIALGGASAACASPFQQREVIVRAARDGAASDATPEATALPAIQHYAAPSSPARRVDHMELPLRLLIPKLGVDAPVIAVGLTSTFAMDVPQRADEVGWYEYSTRPGMKGNAVLAGHLDWQGEPGVFRRLIEMRKGDTVVVRAADGQERPYAVEWNREWPLVTAPVGTVFEPLDQPALTLITCGGRWNPVTQRYDTRVVVRAFR